MKIKLLTSCCLALLSLTTVFASTYASGQTLVIQAEKALGSKNNLHSWSLRNEGSRKFIHYNGSDSFRKPQNNPLSYSFNINQSGCILFNSQPKEMALKMLEETYTTMFGLNYLEATQP